MFEWADSYDTKDWDRLARVVAPYVSVCHFQVPCLR